MTQAALVVGLAFAGAVAPMAISARGRRAWSTLWNSGRFSSRRTLCAALGFVAYPILYFHALQAGPALEANIVNYTWPLFLLIFAWMTGESRTPKARTLGAVVGFLGALVVVVDRRTALMSTNGWQFALAAAGLGAVSYGAYSALARKRPPSADPADDWATFVWMLGAATIGHAVLAAARAAMTGSLPNVDAASVSIPLVWYALVNLGIAHYLWLYVTSRLPSGLAATAVYLVPGLGTVLLAAVDRVWPSDAVACGLALVLVGLYISDRSRPAMGPAVGLAVILFTAAAAVVGFPVPETPPTTDLLMPTALGSAYAVFTGFLLVAGLRRHEKRLSALRKLERTLLRGAEDPATAARVWEGALDSIAAGAMSPSLLTIEHSSDDARARLAVLGDRLTGNLTRYEWGAVAAMALALTGLTLSERAAHPTGAAYALVAIFCVWTIVAALVDYHLGRRWQFRALLARSQAVFVRHFGPSKHLYIPARWLELPEIAGTGNECFIRVEQGTPSRVCCPPRVRRDWLLGVAFALLVVATIVR